MCDAFDFYVHFYDFSLAPRIIGFESAVRILCFEGDSGPRFPFEIWFWKVLALKLLIFGPHLDIYHDNFCFVQENCMGFLGSLPRRLFSSLHERPPSVHESME